MKTKTRGMGARRSQSMRMTSREMSTAHALHNLTGVAHHLVSGLYRYVLKSSVWFIFLSSNAEAGKSGQRRSIAWSIWAT